MGDKSLIFNNMDEKKSPSPLFVQRTMVISIFLIHNIYYGIYLIIAVLPNKNVKSSMRTAAPGLLAFMITML